MNLLRRLPRAIALGVALVAVGFLTGCGGGATAQGLVTADGIPVPVGSVRFVSEDDPKGQAASAAIKDGKYEIGADRGLKSGKYKVEISWSKNPTADKPSTTPAKKFDPDMTSVGGSGGGGAGGTPDNPTRTATMPAVVKAGPNTIDFPIGK